MKTVNCQFLDLDNGCKKRECRHNVLWSDLDLPDGKYTTETLSFGNCMCLLDREFTLQEIGVCWGLTRERIRQIQLDAEMKVGLICKQGKKEELFPDGLGFFKDRYAEYVRKKRIKNS